MIFYAHTLKDQPKEQWEPLFTPFGDGAEECQRNTCQKCEAMVPYHGHLNKVAYWTAKFAAEMFPPGPDRDAAHQWGYIIGLWHDLGKFSEAFQTYLFKASDIHSDEILEKTDHTTAGVKHAIIASPFGHCIATAIAGHHTGLLDARSIGSCMEKRLAKTTEPIPSAPLEILDQSLPPPPTFLYPPGNSFPLAFFQRMLFSSLVDADFLATETFMSPELSDRRFKLNSHEIFPRALQLLEEKIEAFGAPSTSVANARASVVNDCCQRADALPGLFTLTVPTGGGKTLSSLAFALKHAIKNGQSRIIYVVPFTSIIEQNAAVFADLLAPLGEDIVLEHHSNLSPEKETTSSRLASENWDAPIIVTTAVQFYESLFASKTSRSRKLHNIANSVVILDEAQALPVQYLNPCLRSLEQLTTNYHTSIVLCTATQPAISKSTIFPIGLASPTEIISDTQALFKSLHRVSVSYRGQLDDLTIATELADSRQALCIVNTRNHAQNLFRLLPPSDGNFHLSALMCPEHRLRILNTVRNRLSENLPVRLISTQLIEAGVDIDFPLVFRSMAGLDSISQAAGRCNRNGILETGHVHVFHSEHPASERYFQETANVGHEILDLHAADPLSTYAVRAYFEKYFYHQKSKWDSKNIMDEFKIAPRDKKLPLLFNYRTVAENFKLIDDHQIAVIIPWNDQAKRLIDSQLRNESVSLHRSLLRSLQRYSVQIPRHLFGKNTHQFESLRDNQFHVLICPETHYSEKFGLNFLDEPTTLICGD
jgi:CRISPR-associated endonuclease/helicase Cas3